MVLFAVLMRDEAVEKLVLMPLELVLIAAELTVTPDLFVLMARVGI